MGGGKEQAVKQLKVAEAQRRAAKEDLIGPHPVEKEIPLDSLGMTVKIRSMSHKARTEIRKETGWGTESFDESKAELLQIVACLVDPELTFEDVEQLAEQNADVIDELGVEISVLNLTGQAGDLKKD